MYALFATYMQNITTLACKMANDDQKIIRPYKVYQSINFLSMFAILQSDVITFKMYLLNIRAYMHLAGNLLSFLTLQLL